MSKLNGVIIEIDGENYFSVNDRGNKVSFILKDRRGAWRYGANVEPGGVRNLRDWLDCWLKEMGYEFSRDVVDSSRDVHAPDDVFNFDSVYGKKCVIYKLSKGNRSGLIVGGQGACLDFDTLKELGIWINGRVVELELQRSKKKAERMGKIERLKCKVQKLKEEIKGLEKEC